MSRNHAKIWGLYGLSFVVFNIVFFVVFGFSEHSATFWLSYIFSLIAFCSAAVCLWILFNQSVDANSIIYGYAPIKISVSYLIIQVILAFAFSALQDLSAKIAVVVQIVPFVVMVFALVAAFSGKKHAQQSAQRDKQVLFNMKSILADADTVLSLAEDSSVKSAVQKLTDKIKYSDMVSNDALAPLEINIISKIGELRSVVSQKDKALPLCDEISELLDERNIKCKMLK
jgi:hypothetical protein